MIWQPRQAGQPRQMDNQIDRQQLPQREFLVGVESEHRFRSGCALLWATLTSEQTQQKAPRVNPPPQFLNPTVVCMSLCVYIVCDAAGSWLRKKKGAANWPLRGRLVLLLELSNCTEHASWFVVFSQYCSQVAGCYSLETHDQSK